MMKIYQIKTKVITIFCSILILMSGFTSTTIVMADTNGNSSGLVYIDTPTTNSKLSDNTLNISGWSLNKSGVKEVQVSVDNGTTQDAIIGISRQDVDRVFPGYTGGGNSGYTASLDISSLFTGTHSISIKSIGNDGIVTSQNISIYKVPVGGKDMFQMVDIDTPSTNSVSRDGTINISGWSLNGYGIQKVQVYVDNGNETDATIGVARQDVDNAYPGYLGGKTSGYDESLKLPTLSDGTHTIKVVSVGNDGLLATGTVNIKKVSEQNMPSKICIDTPQNNAKTSGNTINVIGWSLNVNGVKQVQVSIDNGTVQDANIGISRLDVDRIFPGYAGGKVSGYSASLDITSLSTGLHEVTINSIGNDGTVTSQKLNINKIPNGGKDMTQRVDIDTPSTNSVSSDGTINVSGWSLNGYGVQKVQVYVDNGNEADATIGLERQDVDNTYPGYLGGKTSGYNAGLKLPTLSDGTHIIKVVSIGYDGSSSTSTVNINKVSEQSIPGKICIDTPNYSQLDAKQIDVTGWSLDLYGVTHVQVAVDNGNMQDATIGLSRTDVDRIYQGYAGGKNSGFATKFDISNLTTGIHTINVVSTGKDGTTVNSNTQIYVHSDTSSELSSQVYIDTPSNDTFIKAQNYLFDVTGWSLNVFGVRKVQVYMDNVYNADATKGISRTDVDRSNPGYTGGANSGYHYVMNISSLSYGAHDLSVRSVGNDGVITTKDLVIYKVYNNTNIASKLVSFLNFQTNLDLAECQALQLHSGVTSNNCVYFSSSVLRDIGIDAPISIANTQHYVPFAASQGWTKDFDVNNLYLGNICFTVPDGTGYPSHTFIFMGWVNPFDHTLAYVADNQSNTIHIRSMIDAPDIDAYSFAFHN